LLIRNSLTADDFDVFLDDESIGSGEFEPVILSQIEAREHFIVLLQPRSLDRIGEDDDWFRREIAHALAHRRNIIPVTANGFEFRPGLKLPADIARLPGFNAIPISQASFKASISRQSTRFLTMPFTPTVPPPPETRSIVDRVRRKLTRAATAMTAEAPQLPAPRLTGRCVNTVHVQLTWTEVAGAEEYVVERARRPLAWSRKASAPEFSEVYRGPDSMHTDGAHSSSLIAWHYRVRAGASGHRWTWSDPIEVITGF
jgi:hypothetical protein